MSQLILCCARPGNLYPPILTHTRHYAKITKQSKSFNCRRGLAIDIVQFEKNRMSLGEGISRLQVQRQVARSREATWCVRLTQERDNF